MRMDDQDESRNVEDARGSSGGGFRPVHGIGLGTIVVALVGGWIFGNFSISRGV
jgi:predicted metalloprotease